MSIWLATDIHGNWEPLALKSKEFSPGDWLLLLGDFDLVRPLAEVVRPLVDAGIRIRWVSGNHDFEDGPKSVGFLREGEAAAWELHCRVEVMDGLRVAGLSGTYSKLNAGSNSYLRRETYLRDGRLPRHLEHVIFHEDIDALLALGDVDIIISHEAPTDHIELELVADALGCKLWIHGHHHRDSVNFLINGAQCRCLEAERLWKLTMPDPETGL